MVITHNVIETSPRITGASQHDEYWGNGQLSNTSICSSNEDLQTTLTDACQKPTLGLSRNLHLSQDLLENPPWGSPKASICLKTCQKTHPGALQISSICTQDMPENPPWGSPKTSICLKTCQKTHPGALQKPPYVSRHARKPTLGLSKNLHMSQDMPETPP